MRTAGGPGDRLPLRATRATEIRTERLLLRMARWDDLDDFFGLMSDPRVMRHWSTPPHPDRATTGAWLGRLIDETPEGQDFVIEWEGRAAGLAGAGRLPEIGFLLRPDLWGRGLAREAMEAVIPHLFAISDVPALTADADPLNAASLRLLDRLGFRETGRAERTFCLDGVWADSVYLALPRPLASAAPPD